MYSNTVTMHCYKQDAYNSMTGTRYDLMVSVPCNVAHG